MADENEPKKIDLSIVSSHFSRVAEFYKNEALMLALGLEKADAMVGEQRKAIELLTPPAKDEK